MAVLAPPVQVVASGAPPFVHVPSGAPPFVVTTGPAPPIMIVASGAPPITLFNDDGSIWAGGSVPVGGAGLLVGETDGFATDFLYATDANRVSLKAANTTTNYAVDAFYANAGTSPKMVYDINGVLGWSPHNYAQQSQTFNNATYWVAENCTIAANAIAAPDGTLTADKFTENSASGAHDLQAGGIPAITGQVSVYAKAAGRTRVMFYDNTSGNGCGFDLTTGATFTVSGLSLAAGSTQDAGNGWWRCSMTCAGMTSYAVYTCNGTAYTYAGDGVSGVYLWGAQVNKGSVPTAYLPTTTAARVGLALDYDPATHAAKGLLCEPAATNTHPWSSDISFLSIENGTATINNQAGPDATLTADTYTENTATGLHGGYGSTTVTANVDYTFSRFYKMGTRRYATLGWSDGTNGAYAVYDLQSGIVGSSAAIAAGVLNSASIQSVGNGWYRCILSAKHGSATGYYTSYAATAASITVDAFGRQSFLGTSSTLFMGHGQLELGTVATSPIPTLAATVTRAADIITVTPASINYSATAGSWWVDVNSLTNIAGKRVVGCQNGSAPIHIESAASFALYDNGGAYASKGGLTIIGNHKVTVAFQTADAAITANGLAVVTNTGATTGSLSPGATIGFGCYPGSLPETWNGYFRKVRYLPRRPPNAELTTMTATVPYAGTIASQVMVTAAAASTGASASFTPPANSTLVAFVSARGGSSATATSLTDSLGSVWVKIGDYLGPNATAFVVTGVYTLAIGPSPVAMTVTGGSTVTGVSMGSGCQVISCTGSIGPLSNTQAGQSGVGSVSLTVSGVSVLTYYVRQTTASTIVIPTGYTELGGAHIQYNNMTASVAYDLTSPGNQNWTGGGNAIAWSGEISG